MKSNVKEDVCYAQPKTLEQRLAIGNDFTKRYNYTVPFGVDDMSDAANDAYSAWPERLYVIDESGHIAYKGGNGPFKYDPKEVRSWLASRYGEVKHPEAETKSATQPGGKPAEKSAESAAPQPTEKNQPAK